jgi:hypothetical protein
MSDTHLPARRSAGRPRRLTLEAVVDAAAGLGIDRIEMTAVAERLGIGVATLYGYVDGRDHLVRLVADRVSRRDDIVDRGQSWQDAVREHAAKIFEIYAAWPELVTQTMAATVSNQVETAPMEGFLALLLDRGLSPQDAIGLFYETNQIVIGAAIGLAYRRALDAKLGGYAAMLRGVLAQHPDEALPALRACAAAADTPAPIGDYHPTLERVIAAHEARLAARSLTPET